MTDDRTTTDQDRKSKDEQLIDERRMDDMAVAPADPKGPAHSKPRADDDGMAQTPKEELEDADRDEENLEEGIEDSMDASDPPSSIQP
ncbi:MAG: hypothetical protein GW859_10480 [Sphingomonadales bacterium]|nr:hypothetical protein [Sphingomonadales bacterium]